MHIKYPHARVVAQANPSRWAILSVDFRLSRVIGNPRFETVPMLRCVTIADSGPSGYFPSAKPRCYRHYKGIASLRSCHPFPSLAYTSEKVPVF